jgi:ubiquinone/menaquinone biosynthesis C-methylase UbiE
MTRRDADEILRQEFNEWAAAGKGEEMERHHISIAEQTIRRMELKPGERVLDLGCGVGWATRIIARLVSDGPESSGQVVGLDVADEMIGRARAASKEFENILYVWGSAQKIPWQENYFDKVLSIESFYYYSDQDHALNELFRVMAPNAKLYILINLYRDNPYSLRWVDELKVSVQVRSEQEYIELLRSHAFMNVEAHRIPDETPTPETYAGRWFKNTEELRDFKRIGALLLVAQKPDVISPPRGIEVL